MPNNHVPTEEQPRETLGSYFQNARILQGKSLEEAARVTCINPSTLASLEANNFAEMPAEVFTRGFIKLYAQYLGLDADQTLKLYIRQENLNPERPDAQPYRRDVLYGTAMANPLGLFKSNPRIRIVAILLAILIGFYAVGAILKLMQKSPDQLAPENELAQSLVESNTQPPPASPGEVPPASEPQGQAGESMLTTLATAPSETQPVTGAAPGGPVPTLPAVSPEKSPATPPVAENISPAAIAGPEATTAPQAARSSGVSTGDGR